MNNIVSLLSQSKLDSSEFRYAIIHMIANDGSRIHYRYISPSVGHEGIGMLCRELEEDIDTIESFNIVVNS